MFSTLPKPNFNFWVTSILSSANAFNLDSSKILSFGKELKYKFTYLVSTLYHTMMTFDVHEEKGFWKLCEKNVKMQVTEFSLFLTMFSTLHKTSSNFWGAYILLSANPFNLDKVDILLSSVWLSTWQLDSTWQILIR